VPASAIELGHHLDSNKKMHPWRGVFLLYINTSFKILKYANHFALVIAVLNILIDMWILILPLNTLKGIKRPQRDKIVLFVIFGTGAFSCLSRLAGKIIFERLC